jgi:hypothetical protein
MRLVACYLHFAPCRFFLTGCAWVLVGLFCLVWMCQLLYFAVIDAVKHGASSELRATLSSHAIWNLRYDRMSMPRSRKSSEIWQSFAIMPVSAQSAI